MLFPRDSRQRLPITIPVFQIHSQATSRPIWKGYQSYMSYDEREVMNRNIEY